MVLRKGYFWNLKIVKRSKSIFRNQTEIDIIAEATSKLI